MTDDLTIPSFLKRTPSAQPLQLRLAHVNRHRWSRPKIHRRPAGDAWTEAFLIEVLLKDEAPTIGSGRRYLWVREGRRWCKLAGFDGRKAKITMAVWKLIARSGRIVGEGP